MPGMPGMSNKGPRNAEELVAARHASSKLDAYT
jgi:hypothetical protein